MLYPIVASDILIFLSYTSISVSIFIFQKKRKDLDRKTSLLLVLFFLFIQACGITHLISAYNYWNSEYVLEMIIKGFTTLLSITSAVYLFQLIPKLLIIPSPESHRKVIKDLQLLNQNLETEVNKRTETIKHQNNLLETIIEGHQGVIIKYHPIFDENGEVKDFKSQLVHGNAYKEFEINESENLFGKPIRATYPEVFRSGYFDKIIDAYMNNKTITEDPIYNPRWDRYFRVTFYKNPNLDYLLVYSTNVTSREKAKAAAVANASLNSLGELAGGIAHEINNPLQVIRGNVRRISRIVQESNEISDKTKNSFQIVDKTIDNIGSIIHNLRRLTQGESNNKKDLPINSTIDRVLSLHESKLHNMGVAIERLYSTRDNNTVHINEISFFQIFNNLIINAYQAMENAAVKILKIDTFEEDDFVYIQVSNNGPLIPDQIVEKIFDPLFTTKESGGGSGLGLSLSKKLAIDMGGDISIRQDNLVNFIIKVRRNYSDSAVC